MIRTVIIDDEPRNLKLMKGIILEHCPELEVVGTTDDLTEILPLLQELKPSLLLLDIEFPGGTIFPVLEKLNITDFQVIFITAHNTYAAEAFKQNAVDYILKPVTSEAIIQAVKRAIARVQQNIPLDIPKLLDAVESELNKSKKIPLPHADGILFIKESDIIRCEASGRYTILYLEAKQRLTVTKTLKEIEALLNSRKFFRVHNSHIINLGNIKKYNRGNGGSIELMDGSLVEVSSSKKNELLNVLLKRTTG
jgi:two-component system LytT family response regulator